MIEALQVSRRDANLHRNNKVRHEDQQYRFCQKHAALTNKALAEPIVITDNGRDRLVVMSAEEYERLRRRDRRVVKLEDFTDEEIALIANANAA